MGAIPKKHPKTVQSVNYKIPKELYTCSYTTNDSAIAYIRSFGLNALMISKPDLSNAFHHILVDHRDWELLWSTWLLVMPDGSTHTSYFLDMFLPFGLHSLLARLSLKFVGDLRYFMAQCVGTPL